MNQQVEQNGFLVQTKTLEVGRITGEEEEKRQLIYRCYLLLQLFGILG
jgi:hypothetical protein